MNLHLYAQIHAIGEHYFPPCMIVGHNSSMIKFRKRFHLPQTVVSEIIFIVWFLQNTS